jgi:hypothetical protein
MTTMNSNRANAKWPTLTHKALQWVLCLVALLVAALAAGAVASATTAAPSSDPAWGGSDPIRISHGSNDRAQWPAIAVNSSDEVAIIWSDERGGTGNIYFTKYNLSAWSAPQAITSTLYDSTQSDLLAVENQFFAAWIEVTGYKVYVTELGSGELSSFTPTYIPVDDSRPSLVATSNHLHVAFSTNDGFGADLYFATRPLASPGWTYAGCIYESTAVMGAFWPAMAASPDKQTLHLVWEERASPTSEAIKYISGTVGSGGSVTWSTTPVVLSTGHTFAIRPDIAVDDDGNVHVTWTEMGALIQSPNVYEQYIRYTRLDAGSSSWLPSRRIDPDYAEVNHDSPTFVAARVATWTDSESGDTTVCVAWHGYREDEPIAEEALLTCSPNGGNTWGDTLNISRSTTPAGEEVSLRPDIAFDSSGDLHVAWQELEEGGNVQYDYEIFYARGGVGSGPVYLPLVLRNH